MQLALLDPGDVLAELLDLTEPVADEHDRATVAAELVDLLGAAALEALVADRQHLVDQQHVGFDVRRDGEAEPDEHARRVVLDRRVDELGEAGELDDVVEAGGDLLLRQSEDRTVEEDVLPTAQLGVEPGAEFEQGRHPSFDQHLALLRLRGCRPWS